MQTPERNTSTAPDHPAIARAAIAASLRQLRTSRGLTIEQFAREIGTFHLALANVEQASPKISDSLYARLAWRDHVIVQMKDTGDYRLKIFHPGNPPILAPITIKGLSPIPFTDNTPLQGRVIGLLRKRA